MRSVQMLVNTKAGVLVLAVLMLVGLAVLTAGCDDSSDSDMYAQISQQAPAGGSMSTPSAAADGAAGAQPGAAGIPEAGAAMPAGELPATGAAGEEGAPATEAEEDPTLIQGVVVENLAVKAPYPEFTGEDRYDVKVTLMTTDPVEAQVFRIVAIGADGAVVGEQERHLKLPTKKARTLNFDDFYCMSIPVAIEFHTSDVGSAAATGEGGNISGRGTAEGGGGAEAGDGSDTGDAGSAGVGAN